MQKCKIVLQDEHDEIPMDADASWSADVPWVMDEVPQDASAACNMDEFDKVCVNC